MTINETVLDGMPRDAVVAPAERTCPAASPISLRMVSIFASSAPPPPAFAQAARAPAC